MREIIFPWPEEMHQYIIKVWCANHNRPTSFCFWQEAVLYDAIDDSLSFVPVNQVIQYEVKK